MQRKELDFDLQYGDRQRIAAVLECSPFTVYKVLSGDRSCTTKLGKQIVQAAKTLEETRQSANTTIKQIAES